MARKRRERPCYLYLIAEQQSDLGAPACKVGISFSPQQRLSELQVGNPRLLYIAGTWKCEGHRDARRIEQIVLENLPMIRGEWVSSPVDMTLVKIEIIFSNLPSSWSQEDPCWVIYPSEVYFQ